MKTFLTLSTLLLLSAPSWAHNYFSKNETCLSTSDIQSVASHFKQFQAFTASQSGEICKGEGIDDHWFEVVRSVLALQRLNVNGAIQRDEDDDLTRRPIQEKDWWGYFIERANDFVVNPAYCSSSPGTVAFVYRFFRGQINLCPRFFEMEAGAQIEVLMHEVRHFDGHPHVTCTQGNEAGSPGACDDTILRGGSYAVSAQVSVELAFVDQMSVEERTLSEAAATYTVNNKFNALPKVKTNDYIYLANQAGELYRALVTKLDGLELVAKLKSPAKVHGNGSQLTIFPLDPAERAYRTSRDLKVNVSGIGAFANLYNAQSAEERSLFSAVNYLGLGAIAKQDTLHAFCGKNANGLSQHQVTAGTLKAILALMTGVKETQSILLTEAGEFLQLNCDQDTGAMSTTAVELGLPTNLVAGLSFKTGEAFLLTDAGELLRADLESRQVSATQLPVSSWISATPIKIHSLFVESKQD